MKHEGVVLKVKGTTAVIMTPGGQFVKVRVKGRPPTVGELYCGEALGSSKTFIRCVAMAATVVLVLISFSALKLYYTAYASVVVDINPSIELVINRWERIIKAVPLNEDGGKVLSGIKLINLSLDAGLKRIVDESIKQEFINGDRAVDDGSISINIYYIGNGKKVDLSKFEGYLTRANLKYEIKQQSSDKYRHEINNRETGAAKESIKDDAGNRKGNIDGKTDDGTKHNDGYDASQGRKDNKEDAKNQGDAGKNTEKENTNKMKDKNLNNSSAVEKRNSDDKGGTNNNMNKEESDINKTGENDSINNKGNEGNGQQGQIYGNDRKFPVEDKDENTVSNEKVDESNVTKTEELNRDAQENKSNKGNEGSGQQGKIYGSDEKFPGGGKDENTVGNEKVNESNVTKTEELNRDAQGNKANHSD